MLEIELAILEEAVLAIHHGPQQTADVWESLRAIGAAGIDGATIDEFWKAAGKRYPPGMRGLSEGGRQELHALMTKICRDLRVERTYWTPDSPAMREVGIVPVCAGTIPS